MTNVIAHLHNLKANRDLAISTTLEYLELTENNFDPQASIDILNNLLYSHLVWRDTTAQQYLADALLNLEKYYDSEAPGLTELRVAQTKNEIGDYETALDYAVLAYEKAALPQLKLQAKVTEATALAGLGELKKAEAIISMHQLNISPDIILNERSSNSVLQLAFLMALKSGDEKLAITLSNRRLQLLSQNFLADASSDTSSILASLENSRARQEERAAAAAREAALLELTIVKQRKLNRTLMALLGLAGLALIGLVAFLRFRERTMKELAIKRKEAASADKLKTDFLGMISHELRTPLNGVIGFSDLLSQTHTDPDVRQKTGVILKSGHELLDVVESMTDMARIDAGQMNILPEDSHLPTLLEEVVEPLQAKAEEKGLAFTHYIDPDLGEHFVDGQRLQQCVRTVLSNAVSFTERGRVHMHVTTQKSSDDVVTGVTVNIADTGVGMSELVQSRLFTPFMQADTSLRRSHMGTGLSLAIAKALTVLMEGELTVVSRVGRGSEFTLTVPLAAPVSVHVETDAVDDIEHVEALLEHEMPAPLPPAILDLMQPVAGRDMAPLHAPPQMPENNLDGLRVLIVDDLENNRRILRDMLEPQGCICFDAPDGEDALEALNAGPLDIVIMDIHMNRLDGVEATRLIRDSRAPFADIPIIALTADNAATTNAACMAAGADIFLTKPVMLDEICRALAFLQTGKSRRTLRQVEAG
ncbi:response regulator [Litorimonas sp. WD9-15]|uniref:response regulator n=1 Tax=Litorimonas sp. WD9-15 TaxID=3418716 RepID=UPI003CFC8205